MTERMTLVQARVSEEQARQLDDDAQILGLATRSDALREGLRLLHRQARQAALAHDYDSFYGAGVQAPVSDITAIGDEVAAQTLATEATTR